MFEEDQTAKAPPTQAVRQHPARPATAGTGAKPNTGKEGRGPAEGHQPRPGGPVPQARNSIRSLKFPCEDARGEPSGTKSRRGW